MPAYTLFYFNGRGRAEILRMLFAVADVKYTDKRIEFNDWEKYKKDMPSLTVPVLEIDGKNKMPETMAIARFLAREFGFSGKTNLDMFRIDYICDCLYEVMHDYMRYFHEKNGRFRTGTTGNASPNNVTVELQRCYMDTCRRVLPFLERTLESRNNGSQYFMGDQIMLCDMMCYAFLENSFNENQAMFTSYPKLMGLRTKVAAHPKISAYLKKRPTSSW